MKHKVMLLAELNTGICQKMAIICMNLLDWYLHGAFQKNLQYVT